jgi:parvulin-like peptidyl-prolyl isomerase
MSALRYILVAGMLVACGGQSAQEPASSPADAAEPTSAAPLSEADQCIADADAPRSASGVRPDKIHARHILVRHAELDHPRGATRSRGEACLRALDALHALQGGATWDETVKEYSDAPGATMGDIGDIGPDDVKKPFADAAFALDVDQLSYVVETDAGFHIILRTE